MTSIRFACPTEARRLRDHAEQLERIGKLEAAGLWRELADRIEAKQMAGTISVTGRIEELAAAQ
jgi:hypothetical protein